MSPVQFRYAVRAASLPIIPATMVSGGGGGGTGHDEKGHDGEGGGFGVIGRPAGAYVISNGEVDWRPFVHTTSVAPENA